MRIVMFTNTYTPHVGGVARSVDAFAREFRRRGHEVLVVAPEFHGMPTGEQDVVRIRAIQNFNGSDFSLALWAPGELRDRLDAFQPDIVHSHHPFLLGNVAAREARACELPLVVTHHTLYERYTHYVPADSALLRRFVIELATCYANLCDRVFAPSESIAALLEERGVETPISVVPTGVDYPFFSQADGAAFRAQHGIVEDCFLVGHVGRLAPEKNLGFLTAAVIAFLGAMPAAQFLLAGTGPSRHAVIAAFAQAGMTNRLICLGQLDHERLRNVYAAMDVFAFASLSETQGMVLTEAMATGTPVVAIEASGVREIVADGRNGRLVSRQDRDEFVAGLRWVANLDSARYRELRQAADATGRACSMERCAERALSIYAQLLQQSVHQPKKFAPLQRIIHQIAAEWDIISGGARALRVATMSQLVESERDEKTAGGE
jgi:glycosyltransferase involved in cell wall biosynthesis